MQFLANIDGKPGTGEDNRMDGYHDSPLPSGPYMQLTRLLSENEYTTAMRKPSTSASESGEPLYIEYQLQTVHDAPLQTHE